MHSPFRMSRRRACAAVAMALAAHTPSRAQAPYPARAVRIVVPFGPGSGADNFARFAAEKLGHALGQPVIVDNKAGADGIIGTQEVARAAPDGYTLLLGSNSTLAFNPAARHDLPYRPQDFRAVYGLNQGAAVLVCPAPSPFQTLADAVAEARKRPDQLSIGNYSPALQMASAWFASMAGAKVVHVPYKGAGPMVTDLIGNQLPLAIADISAVTAHVAAGKLRLLAVAGAERLAVAPSAPTTREAGFPEFRHTSWIGLFAPAGTPDAAIARLAAALAEISATPEFLALVERNAGMPMRMDAAQLQEWVASEAARYQKLVKLAGLA